MASGWLALVLPSLWLAEDRVWGCLSWWCRGGYGGFHDEHRQPIELTPAMVDQIHHEGGTILGSSRGGFDLDKIIDFLHEKDICQVLLLP